MYFSDLSQCRFISIGSEMKLKVFLWQHSWEPRSNKVDSDTILKSIGHPQRDEKVHETPMEADCLQFADNELLDHWWPARLQSATYHPRELLCNPGQGFLK